MNDYEPLNNMSQDKKLREMIAQGAVMMPGCANASMDAARSSKRLRCGLRRGAGMGEFHGWRSGHRIVVDGGSYETRRLCCARGEIPRLLMADTGLAKAKLSRKRFARWRRPDYGRVSPSTETRISKTLRPICPAKHVDLKMRSRESKARWRHAATKIF